MCPAAHVLLDVLDVAACAHAIAQGFEELRDLGSKLYATDCRSGIRLFLAGHLR